MDVLVRRPGDEIPGASRDGVLTCALVNNMPDGALAQTKRQFVAVLEGVRAPVAVELREYSLPSVRRAAPAAAHVERAFFTVDDLLGSRPDAVIVTGAEPVTARLEDEAYWGDLVEVIEWAVAGTGSLVLSCLAAHAALLALDDVARVRLESKRTGVFEQSVDTSRPLAAGLPGTVRLPHSRLNDVPTDKVRDAGYDVLVASPDVGWGVVGRRIGGCEVLLCQGHPEYGATSLLREYRRDVDRFVTGASPIAPVLPVGCVAPEDDEEILAFHERVLAGGRGSDPATALAFDELTSRVRQPWQSFACELFGRWLGVGSGTRSVSGHRREVPDPARATAN